MEECISNVYFLVFLHIIDDKKDVRIIFKALTKSMKEWGLEIYKCIVFGCDDVVMMIGKWTWVAAWFKDQMNQILTF